MPLDHRRARRLTTTVAALALVCAVGAAVLAALGARHVSAAAADSTVRTEALAAGRQIAVDYASYDYRHLAEDFKRAASESTGAFKKQFLSASTGAQELIVRAKAVATAQVTSAGVVDASPGRATIVLALDRTIRNTTVPNGQSDSFGLQMTLVRSDGRWLASEVKPL